MIPSKHALRHLTRLEYADQSHGWLLRLTASAAASGDPFEMHFADGHFGGKEGSLCAAQAQRDALEDPRRKGCHLRATAASQQRGLPAGVRLVWTERPSGPLVMWEAMWTEDKMHRRKRWSITAHGYRGAFFKALKQREEKSGLDLSGYDCPPIETMLDAKRTAQLSQHPNRAPFEN